MKNKKLALLIGNTDGIGEKTTQKLLERNFSVIGISKSPSKITHSNYQHFTQDVSSIEYRALLNQLVISHPNIDLCIYFAGIGDELNLNNLAFETKVFEVNLMAAVITTEIILSSMLKRNSGHFIGLSSVADMITSPEAPSYSASKSGISKYWEGLGIALKTKSNVKISNIRFGFVNTKMAKSPVKPFLMSTDSAVEFIFEVIQKPKIRATKPKMIIPLLWLVWVINQFKLN